jgi:hypothetical protein
MVTTSSPDTEPFSWSARYCRDVLERLTTTARSLHGMPVRCVDGWQPVKCLLAARQSSALRETGGQLWWRMKIPIIS